MNISFIFFLNKKKIKIQYFLQSRSSLLPSCCSYPGSFYSWRRERTVSVCHRFSFPFPFSMSLSLARSRSLARSLVLARSLARPPSRSLSRSLTLKYYMTLVHPHTTESGLGRIWDEVRTVDYYLIGTWFNSFSDLAARILWSQFFTGFYNVDFSWFNNTWFNSQTWFTSTSFLSHWKIIPILTTSIYDLIKLKNLFFIC